MWRRLYIVKNCLTPAVIIQQFVSALQEKSSSAAGSHTVSELDNAVMYWVIRMSNKSLSERD